MKTYLVSGAGSGIGRAISKQLSKEGHRIFLLGRNMKNLEETLQMLSGTQHKILQADIRDKQALLAASDKIKGESIDGMVAASGMGGINAWGEGDRWDDIISTNLNGTYYFVNTFYPHLKKSSASYKHVILLSSAMARVGIPYYQALSTTKAGLLGLMRSWAVQWSAENILVNAICPGWVNTAMSDEALDTFANAYNISREEALKQAMQNVPLKKMTEPEEIADLVSYMFKQTSMTGGAVDINCGLIMNN